ncbi:MAG: (2Fe-2S)-binding protein [Planctomycetes bacterium]|nr:(2Fe-2S)-binding protein [Planctomycetota bacterium]
MGERLLCRCFRVTEAAVRNAIREKGLRTVEQVTACTRAAGGCSSCTDDVQAILDEIHGKAPVPAAKETPDNAETRRLIQEAFDKCGRRLFGLNEADVDFLDVQAERVFTRFRGRNVGTSSPSILTLKWYLVRIMSDACGRKMQQIEMNVLDTQDAVTLP